MRDFIKRNFVILLAFAIPIVFIVVVALGTYLPSAFLSTDYNFVYASCSNGRNHYPYQCDEYIQNRFSIVDNRLDLNDVDLVQNSDNDGIRNVEEDYKVRIFMHNTKENESREVTLEEAQELELSGLITSPDGVTVSNHYDRGSDLFFIFGGGYSSYGYYLTKGDSKTKLNLINSGESSYYRDNIEFIGWVLPGRNN